MWKSKEERIKEHYHPKHLLEFIKTNDDYNKDIDDFLCVW
jgi:hypothetical protein